MFQYVIIALLFLGFTGLFWAAYDTLFQTTPADSRLRELVKNTAGSTVNTDKRSMKGSMFQPTPFMKKTVKKLQLTRYFVSEDTRSRLIRAGHRSPATEITVAFANFAMPLAFSGLAFFYIGILGAGPGSPIVKTLIILGAFFFGYKLPSILIWNEITKRKAAFIEYWPDALDLLQICIEAGMSIEQALTKVSDEMEDTAPVLADEFNVLLADINYTNDRIAAYDKFWDRTQNDATREFSMALINASQNGTPMGTVLKTLSMQSQTDRMNKAEQKAASLGPKLTVPMIIFFLPVIFIIIGTPAYIGIINSTSN